jgi:ribosomal protein L35
LLEDFHQSAAKHPLIREKATAAVRWRLFKAGGLKKGQSAKRVEHIPETRPQERQKSLRQRGRGHE